MTNYFKEKYTLSQRYEKSKVVIDKYYPQRVPVIIQKQQREKTLPDLTKHKFLVPMDMKYCSLLFAIRNKMKYEINPSVSLFIMTENGNILSSSDLISKIYDEHADKKDNFLYLFYCGENTFGSDDNLNR